MVTKYGLSFSSTTKFRLKLMFCVTTPHFYIVLVWRRFDVPLFPIRVPLSPIHVPLVPLRVPSLHIRVPSFPIRILSFLTCVLSFPIRVLSFSIRVLSFLTRILSFPIRVHLSPIRVDLSPIRVHLSPIRVHLFPIRVPFVFSISHSCSLVFPSVWCFRYDHQTHPSIFLVRNVLNASSMTPFILIPLTT